MLMRVGGLQSPVWDIFGPLGFKNQSFCMRSGPFSEWTNGNGEQPTDMTRTVR
jgi:hypothetical protein